MSRKKKVVKAKEPAKIRVKELANGNQSIYLDIYKDGKRAYEFLGLYLWPKEVANAKAHNEEALMQASAIKEQRNIEISESERIGIPKRKSKVLLLDFIKAYQKEMESRGAAGARLYNSLTIALEAFKADKVMLKDIDKDFCTKFSAFLSKEYVSIHTHKLLTSTTAKIVTEQLNRVLKAAVKKELIPSNPFDMVDSEDKIKANEREVEYLTEDEVKLLMATPCGSDMVKRAYLFACFCGLRVSDVTALKWSSIEKDGEKYKVKVVMKKTKKSIHIKLSNHAQRWMPERGSAADTDNIFHLPTLSTIERYLAKWAKAAGITKHVTFHTSRHTFATMMLTFGADIYTTSKLLGHSKLETTQRYAKVVNKKMDEAITLADEMFND